MIGRLPLDQQLESLRATLCRNEVLTEVLARTATLDLPGWYVTAGCLFQTVWNVATGRPPTNGIKDYDVFYFDAGDRSWEAENAVIEAARDVFSGLPAEVEIRNEARVHLWYEEKFDVACPPYESTEAAIDSFPATTCCLGVRTEADGTWRVYAPHGLSDVFNLVVRPNPVLAPRSVYEAKTARWREQWPELTVLEWPSASAGAPVSPGLRETEDLSHRRPCQPSPCDAGRSVPGRSQNGGSVKSEPVQTGATGSASRC